MLLMEMPSLGAHACLKGRFLGAVRTTNAQAAGAVLEFTEMWGHELSPPHL